jgi:hypothetical protein
MHFLFSIYYELVASTCFKYSSSGGTAFTTIGIYAQNIPSLVYVVPPDGKGGGSKGQCVVPGVHILLGGVCH